MNLIRTILEIAPVDDAAPGAVLYEKPVAGTKIHAFN